MVMDWTGDVAKKLELVDPDGISHSFTGWFSLEDDPRLRVGVMRAAVGVSVGRSARRHKVDACSEQYARRDGAKVGFCAFLRLGFTRLG